MAGPCSVESAEQVTEIAKAVKASGANVLRGGAFKPRTSPYSFQGLKAEGLELLLKAKEETGLPIVTEIMSESDIDLFKDVDIIQVGARNMQNFTLLKKLGKLDKPILLKRGLCATIEEWLMSAEYIMAEGNEKVSFVKEVFVHMKNIQETLLTFQLFLLLRSLSHLPVVVDPSHATGMNWSVEIISNGCCSLWCRLVLLLKYTTTHLMHYVMVHSHLHLKNLTQL